MKDTNFVAWRKRVVTLLFSILLSGNLWGTARAEEEPFFDDVRFDTHAYCYEAVKWAHNAGIVQGNDASDGNGNTIRNFHPDSVCVRAHIITFLWRYAGSPEYSGAFQFPDINEKAYYYPAVMWASENKIAKGYASGNFEPAKGVTRGEAVTFLWRYAGCPEPNKTAMPFEDVADGKIYYKAVLWAAQNKITDGVTPFSFAPEQACKRGHIAKYLYQYDRYATAMSG